MHRTIGTDEQDHNGTDAEDHWDRRRGPRYAVGVLLSSQKRFPVLSTQSAMSLPLYETGLFEFLYENDSEFN